MGGLIPVDRQQAAVTAVVVFLLFLMMGKAIILLLRGERVTLRRAIRGKHERRSRPADTTAQRQPAAPILEVTVRSGGGLIGVRLERARPIAAAAPYVWLVPGAPGPPASPGSAWVFVGRNRGRALWVDLAMAPGAVSVTGPWSSTLAREFAVQLGASGLRILAMGGVLGANLPPRCRQPTEREATTGQIRPDTDVVLTPHPYRGPSDRRAHQPIRLVIADVRPARWSFHMRPRRDGYAAGAQY